MKYPKFILYYEEYNGMCESMNPDSWDDREYTFESEEDLKAFISKKFEFLFRVRAIYKLEEGML